MEDEGMQYGDIKKRYLSMEARASEAERVAEELR